MILLMELNVKINAILVVTPITVNVIYVLTTLKINALAQMKTLILMDKEVLVLNVMAYVEQEVNVSNVH